MRKETDDKATKLLQLHFLNSEMKMRNSQNCVVLKLVCVKKLKE